MPIDLPLQDPVVQFTALVVTALVAQTLFGRLHIPGLIGLLLVGMLLGPGGANVLPRGEVIGLLGSVGLVYLMFQAGLEIDLDMLSRRRRETASFGLLAFVLSLAPAIAAGILLLGFDWAAALMLGTLISSHTLVAYPLVERMRLLHRPGVVSAIGGTLITDTLALVLLVVVLQVAGDYERLGPWWLPLVLLAVLAAAAFWLVPRAGRRVLAQDLRRAEKALFVLTVVLLLASMAQAIGTEKILGAFLAGITLNRLLKQRADLLEHLEFVGRMLFIPFFFIETGMRLELEVFTGAPEVWLLAGLLLLLVFAGKTAAAWLTGLSFGYPRASRVMMVGLTTPQAAATLAVTISAQQAGLFGEEVVDAVILVIFATCVIGPLLTGFSGRRLLATSDAPRRDGGEGGPEV